MTFLAPAMRGFLPFSSLFFCTRAVSAPSLGGFAAATDAGGGTGMAREGGEQGWSLPPSPPPSPPTPLSVRLGRRLPGESAGGRGGGGGGGAAAAAATDWALTPPTTAGGALRQHHARGDPSPPPPASVPPRGVRGLAVASSASATVVCVASPARRSRARPLGDWAPRHSSFRAGSIHLPTAFTTTRPSPPPSTAYPSRPLPPRLDRAGAVRGTLKIFGVVIPWALPPSPWEPRVAAAASRAPTAALRSRFCALQRRRSVVWWWSWWWGWGWWWLRLGVGGAAVLSTRRCAGPVRTGARLWRTCASGGGARGAAGAHWPALRLPAA